MAAPSQSEVLMSHSDSKYVAFTAKMDVHSSYPKHSGVLKFMDVLVNEGNAYSPGTGIFTCPVDGLYHFTVHMSVCGTGQCAIYKNGEKVVSVFHNSNKYSHVATVGSVVKLCKNDTVWVNLWGNGRNDIFATEDNDTVFVGFLLNKKH